MSNSNSNIHLIDYGTTATATATTINDPNPPPAMNDDDTAAADRRLDELLAQSYHPPPRLPASTILPAKTTAKTSPHVRSQSLVLGQQRPNFRRPRRPHPRRKEDLQQQQQQPQSQQHHRRHTSLGEWWHDVEQESSIQLDTVRAQFLQELRDYDSGNFNYLMDMSVTRSLSVLPEDLTEFVKETVYLQDVGEEEEEEAEPLLMPAGAAAVAATPVAAQPIPASAYIMLLIAVLAVSSNGTALHLLYGVPAPLKLFWRMTVTCGLLSLFALKACLYNKSVSSLSWAHWNLLLLAASCFCAHALLLYTALEYTTIGNALIYANSQALLLIVGKAVMGGSVTCMEGLGVVTAFTGALLCTRDSEGQAAADPSDQDTPATALFGDLLALASAVTGVAYLTLAKAVRPHLSVTVFMFLVTFLSSWMVLAYLYFCSGVAVTWDRHVQTGLWGWLTWEDHHVWILLYIAVVCNVCGTMGFVRAMQHFDTILIAVATLLEPMIASCIAFVFRVGLLPGPLGYLGNALVTAGTLAVVASSSAAGKPTAAGH